MKLSLNIQQIGYSCILYLPIYILIDLGIVFFTNTFNYDDLLGLFLLPLVTILFLLVFVQLIHKLLKINNWSIIVFFSFFVILFECLTYTITDTTYLSILYESSNKEVSIKKFIVILILLNNYLALIISIITVKMLLYFNSRQHQNKKI